MSADWSKTSQMPKRYWHFGQSSSIPALEKAQGIFRVDGSDGNGNGNASALKSNIICNFCREPNKPEAKFCANPKCGFVLTHEANREREKEVEETKRRLAELEEKMESLRKIAIKQSFRVIEKEVEANPIPYIEGADKMTPQEILYEMQKRGVTTWEG